MLPTPALQVLSCFLPLQVLSCCLTLTGNTPLSFPSGYCPAPSPTRILLLLPLPERSCFLHLLVFSCFLPWQVLSYTTYLPPMLKVMHYPVAQTFIYWQCYALLLLVRVLFCSLPSFPRLVVLICFLPNYMLSCSLPSNMLASYLKKIPG